MIQQQNVSSQINERSQQSTSTYSQVFQDSLFPKKEQAIIVDSQDDLTIKEYTTAVGQMIEPKNILFVSRISNNRICFYLSKQNIVDKLVEKPTYVQVGVHRLLIRSLITKTKRIIISNVCPIIPHSVIINKLNDMGITPVSNLTFIKAGLNEPEYSHILSFRRQFYTKQEDAEKIQESFSIKHDGTDYWIHTSANSMTYFLCKEPGHLAKHCKATIQNDTNTSVSSSQDPIDNSNESPTILSATKETQT